MTVDESSLTYTTLCIGHRALPFYVIRAKHRQFSGHHPDSFRVSLTVLHIHVL